MMKIGAIQKNGASLKSHQRIFSKRLLFLAVFMYSAIVLTAQEIKLKQEYFPDGKIKVERTYEKGSTTNFVSKHYYDNGAVSSEGHYTINRENIAEMSDIWTKEEIEDAIEACSDLTRIKYYGKEGALAEEIEVVGKEYPYKKYYKSGKLAETGYRTGESYTNARQGLVKGYYESGKPKYEENYIGPGELKDGKQVYWYETGKTQYEANYKGGKKDGITKRYYETGKTRYEFSYKNGLQDDKYITYDTTGQRIEEAVNALSLAQQTANAEIARAFEKDAGVELDEKFDDMVAKARAKLDDRSYEWTLDFFRRNFAEKHPETGGDLFTEKEKQILFGIAMDLLANEPENPTEGDLTLTLEEWDCLDYFEMGLSGYRVMLNAIEGSAEIDRLDAELAEICAWLEQNKETMKQLTQKQYNALFGFYNDCLQTSDATMKRKFHATIENTVKGYESRRLELPQQIKELYEKVQNWR